MQFVRRAVLASAISASIGLMAYQAHAAYQCCNPAVEETRAVVACSPAAAPCDGTCKSRSGEWSGGCADSDNVLNSCTESTRSVTHTVKTFDCQDNNAKSCPCPPAGEPVPNTTEEVTVNITDCTGSGC